MGYFLHDIFQVSRALNTKILTPTEGLPLGKTMQHLKYLINLEESKMLKIVAGNK
ncbi:MAG: hypothetical protein MUO21_07400 [Nitrososphaeraceae archaeon]|nr:hypothetical protein [Nitrososphaeraceae archaeon]